ncbi:MAG: hypothetical protein GXO93_06370 [FCB group bacterium]|nr:hypothetical protein [FCB group bacterium]
MTEEVKKKGLSKGCLIGLIVVGALLVLIIILTITCYAKREDLAKFAAVTIVNGAKNIVAKTPPQGIDTVQFDAVVDSFIQKINKAPFDKEKYATFFRKIQSVSSDKKIDSTEAIQMMQAMYDYFPDLKKLPSPEKTSDSTAVPDTLSGR